MKMSISEIQRMLGKKSKVIVLFAVTAVGLLAQLGLGARTPLLRDVAEANGFLKYNELDLRKDDNKYWGSTIADINRDGVYDFWLSAHGNNPELYVSKQGGGYEYVNPDLRFKDLHATAAADVDNDGYLDLFINLGGSNGNVVKGHPLVYLSSTGKYDFNTENGKTIGIGDTPFRGRSTSFLDVNGDGCLDLLYINRPNISMTYAHLLYENQCDGTFRLRNNTGIEEVNAGWHQIVDVNNDSLPDILFIWYTGVELWLGTGDFKFVDGTDLIPEAARVKMRDCRTVAEIDYDNDGDMDLLFLRGKPKEDLDDVLLENIGTGFLDVSVPSGIARGGEHYHVTTGDLNNDGYTDLYISVATYPKPRVDDVVLLNNGDKTFSPASGTGMEIAATAPQTDGDNANIFDYNNDGRADVLVGSRNSAWKLYENRTPVSNTHYILVRVGAPRAQVGWPEFTQKALGALVKVFCGDQIMMARVGSPGQSHSQSYMDTLHFGLGACDFIKKIEVHYWHDIVVTRTGVAADQMVEIGLYFPCPEGRLGQDCGEQMKSCNTAGCEAGETCDVAELVGSKCKEDGCSQEPIESVELFVNGDFESSNGWKRDAVGYRNGGQFEGAQYLLMWEDYYSRVEQNVELEANTEYVFSCKMIGAPVRFKVFKDGVGVARDVEEASEETSNGSWKGKSMAFTTTEGGLHRIVVDKRKEDGETRLDDCSLKAVEATQSNCCLKVFCTI